MANNNRICIICGKEYEFCGHCKDSKPEDSWKYIYHDEKCMEISKTIRAYRGHMISKEGAKKVLGNIKPNIDDAINYNSIAVKELNEIFYSEKKVEEKIDENKDVQTVEEPKRIQYKSSKKRNQKAIEEK